VNLVGGEPTSVVRAWVGGFLGVAASTKPLKMTKFYQKRKQKRAFLAVFDCF
jgi:hypothetical protein